MKLKDQILETKLADHQVALFYLGQVGFLLQYRGRYLLIDGYLSDYVDQNCCSETVRWVRKYPAPMPATDLDFVDYVLLTHAHFDHADPYTIRDLLSVNQKATFVISSALTEQLQSYGVPKERILEAEADCPLCPEDGIEIIPLPSAHEVLHTDEQGRYLELGYKVKLGDMSVYHSGDCCMYAGLTERVSGCDILILPINGRDYFRTQDDDIIGCFNVPEAVRLAKEAKAGMLIPVHFDLYAVNEESPAYFVDTLYRTAFGMRYHIFAPGERYIYQK